MRFIPACLFFLLMTGTAFAATYYVPDDFPAIQAAIDSPAVVDGDTVIVRAGTYAENINFLGKAITLQSESGPEKTVIDGKNGVNPYQSVVTFESGEGLDSVLDGFTVTGGKGRNIFIYDFVGGGICCLDASPTIRNNIVRNNSVQVIHGGWASGGGIYCNDAALIENNVIHDNGAGGYGSGGGLACFGSCLVKDNIIRDNSAAYGGGGIQCDNSCRVEHNTIYQNTAGEGGGGIECKGFTVIANNRVFDNVGGTIEPGGGIACSKYAVLEGNILYNNTDCGISCRDTCILNNNTLHGNNGPGIWVSQYSAQPEIKNTILWNNTGPEIELAGSGAKPKVTYCDVEGGWPGAGNIDADPLFEDPVNYDFHLTWLSPCVNRGNNAGLVTTTDIDGDPRPYMGTVEMGADEFGGLHALGADKFSLSEASGGYVDLYLFGGAPGGGRYYLVLGSVTGTSPGMILPGGAATLPLNWDFFTNIVLGLLNTPVFQNFTGQLTWGSSTGWARLDTLGPVPGAAGLTLSFAFALAHPWDFASNPVNVEIVP